jgi:hypothetical protein
MRVILSPIEESVSKCDVDECHKGASTRAEYESDVVLQNQLHLFCNEHVRNYVELVVLGGWRVA